MNAVETRGLTRSFGSLRAVDGVDLAVEAGELFALLGPNGAGKTTTIRLLCCLLRPGGGSASVMGHDVATESIAVKRVIAVSPQETAVAEHLDAWENLALMAGMHGVEKQERHERSARLLDLMGLTERGHDRVKRYSGGMKRRLSLAMALVTEPEVLFLDEPTLGLDPQSRRAIWAHIERLKGATTVVLTTHYLEEADALADRVAIIDDGRIVALGTPDDLKQRVDGARVTIIEASGVTDEAVAALRGLHPGATVDRGRIEIAADDVSLYAIEDVLRPLGVVIESTYRRTVTLDDVFLELTGKELR